eukprot:SAG11_NODE_4956_length_1711_cov_1.112283_1_plen_96_part_10
MTVVVGNGGLQAPASVNLHTIEIFQKLHKRSNLTMFSSAMDVTRGSGIVQYEDTTRGAGRWHDMGRHFLLAPPILAFVMCTANLTLEQDIVKETGG